MDHLEFSNLLLSECWTMGNQDNVLTVICFLLYRRISGSICFFLPYCLVSIGLACSLLMWRNGGGPLCRQQSRNLSFSFWYLITNTQQTTNTQYKHTTQTRNTTISQPLLLYLIFDRQLCALQLLVSSYWKTCYNKNFVRQSRSSDLGGCSRVAK